MLLHPLLLGRVEGLPFPSVRDIEQLLHAGFHRKHTVLAAIERPVVEGLYWRTVLYSSVPDAGVEDGSDPRIPALADRSVFLSVPTFLALVIQPDVGDKLFSGVEPTDRTDLAPENGHRPPVCARNRAENLYALLTRGALVDLLFQTVDLLFQAEQLLGHVNQCESSVFVLLTGNALPSS